MSGMIRSATPQPTPTNNIQLTGTITSSVLCTNSSTGDRVKVAPQFNVKQSTVDIIGSVAILPHPPKDGVVWDILVEDKSGNPVSIYTPVVHLNQILMARAVNDVHHFDCDGFKITVTYLID
jgi:hypothetical protein